MAMRKREEEVVFPSAAGIDVGASSHWVAVPRNAADDPIREFGAMTDDLNAMADLLLACGVDTAALESTEEGCLESQGKGMKEIDDLLVHGGEVGADGTKGICAVLGSEASRDFLFDLGHANGLFGEVVVKGTLWSVANRQTSSA